MSIGATSILDQPYLDDDDDSQDCFKILFVYCEDPMICKIQLHARFIWKQN